MTQGGGSTTAPSLLRRGLFEAKTLVAAHPFPALTIARRRHGVVVGDHTEIVIEGFPRTGTSFAVAAFLQAQERRVIAACHVHAPAQIVAGVRRGIPVILVVRAPNDTILSFAIRNPHLSLAQAARGYIRFYRPLIPILDDVVVASFDAVTQDLGGVIDRVNERYRTTFARFEPTEEHVAEVFAAIDRDYQARVSGEAFERSVARPSQERAKWKAELSTAWQDDRLAGVRREAERVYATVAARSG